MTEKVFIFYAHLNRIIPWSRYHSHYRLSKKKKTFEMFEYSKENADGGGLKYTAVLTLLLEYNVWLLPLTALCV